jgi:hypothetical protein
MCNPKSQYLPAGLINSWRDPAGYKQAIQRENPKQFLNPNYPMPQTNEFGDWDLGN